MRHFLSFTLLFILVSSTLTAQNRRALRDYEHARESVRAGKYQEALEYISSAVSSSSDFSDAWMFKADIHTYLGQGEEMMNAYAHAMTEDAPKAIYFRWTDAALRFGYYKEADSLIALYLNSSEVNRRYIEKAQAYKNQAQFGIRQLQSPVPFEPNSLGEDVNSLEMQYFPSVSGDGKTLVFTARNLSSAPLDEDFYSSSKDENGHWSSATRLTGHLNTTGNEGAQALSADGNFIFFAGCNRQDGHGSCDIYVSRKLKDGTWDKPFNLGERINSRFWESQPSISADGKTLLFVRARNGSGDKGDIYVSTYYNGTWSEAIPLPGDVNTSGSDQSPFLHFDGRTLYFSSDGHLGMGSGDLFVAHKNEEGEWTDVQNLGYPINTYRDEFSLAVAPDGKTAFYSSDRGNEVNELDLYSFELPSEVRATPIEWINGLVIEDVVRTPVKALLSFTDLETGEIVLSEKNNSDGTFFVSLPSKSSYVVNATAPGYLFYSETIDLSELNDASVVDIEIVLKPIVAGEKAILKNVFFEHDSFELKPTSKIELDQLVHFLELNPETKMRIDGHTDNEGQDSYNQKLSLNRAESVQAYLVSKGITANRLSVKGFGANEPISDNSTEEGRALNRRTEFTIL